MHLVDLLTETTNFLETQPTPEHVSQAEFDQLLAEAVHKTNPNLMLDCLRFFRDRYGWPLPDDKRALVGAALGMIVIGLNSGLMKVHRPH